MPDTSKRFRDRALDCRNLAKSARSEVDASILEDMAAELEEEPTRSTRRMRTRTASTTPSSAQDRSRLAAFYNALPAARVLSELRDLQPCQQPYAPLLPASAGKRVPDPCANPTMANRQEIILFGGRTSQGFWCPGSNSKLPFKAHQSHEGGIIVSHMQIVAVEIASFGELPPVCNPDNARAEPVD